MEITYTGISLLDQCAKDALLQTMFDAVPKSAKLN